MVASAAFVPAVCAASPASPEEGGGLVGWVESSRGAPLAGAMVSVFGKGIRGGSLVTLADSRGQLVLPSLPAGSYTLRAISAGHEPSAAQRVTVLPNRDALFTLSLNPVGELEPDPPEDAAADAEASEARREWRWLVRHKRRSVLETAGHSGGTESTAALSPAAAPPSLADLGTLAASMEFAATADGRSLADHDTAGLPGGLGSLQLQGRLTDGVAWSLGGLMAESEGRAWRLAAEFVLEPGGGHEVEVGAGYGAADMPTLVDDVAPAEPRRSQGAVFLKDRWRLSDRFTAIGGARYTYVGFLPDSHHADAVVEVELRGDRRTLVRGSVATRTLAPGGDLLTLSTVAASPAITWARLEDGLRPAHTLRYELGVDRDLGAGRLGARVFDESTRDVLLTTFDGRTPIVRNAGRFGARGFGVTLGGRLGGVVKGSVTYTFGHGRRSAGVPFDAPLTQFEESEFHDLVARFETVIDWTDTRLAALYRLNALSDDRPLSLRGSSGSVTSTRFDVQLTQGLPFLQPLTRADWELLVAVRNMFYEASQAGFLDELAVQDPPTRVVGGISVRF